MRPAYWEINRPGGRSTHKGAVELGRKFCAGCGRWRHACDFAAHRGRPRSRCRACQRAYQRAWRAQMTPEQRDRNREYFRIWEEAKRRERGIAPRRFHRRRNVTDRIEFVGLPPEPLVDTIARRGLTDVELAAEAQVTPRSIYRLRTGQSRHVRIDLADKLAVALGVPLAVLYGDQPAINIRTGEPVTS